MKKREYVKFIEGDLYYIMMDGQVPIIKRDIFYKRFLSKTTLHGLYHCIEFEYKDLFSTLEEAENVRLDILISQLEEKMAEFKEFEDYVKVEIGKTFTNRGNRHKENSEKNKPKLNKRLDSKAV